MSINHNRSGVCFSTKSSLPFIVVAWRRQEDETLILEKAGKYLVHDVLETSTNSTKQYTTFEPVSPSNVASLDSEEK